MFSNYRIVSFSPAGRKRNMALLDRFLRANRFLIDRHEWWVNTPDEGDEAFIHEMVERHPGFYSAAQVDVPYGQFDYGVILKRLRRFYQERCQDTRTIYLKIDDDFCFIGKDAIADLLEFRVAHPDYFLVMPPTVNSVLHNHVCQRLALLPREPILSYDPATVHGYSSGAGAEIVHRGFLSSLEHRSIEWTFPRWEFNEFERATIGAICFFGRDFASFGSDVTDDDEHFLSCVKPRELNRVNAVAPCWPHRDAFFAHYAYSPQKAHLDASDVLSSYEAIGTQRKLT